MATRQVFQEVTINCDPEAIFAYLTEPGRWHEWSPSYRPTRSGYRVQKAGQEFEMVAAQPLVPLLPFHFSTSLNYVVSRSDPPYLWEVEGTSEHIEIVTSYTLSRSEEGTVFKRHFRYSTKGWFRYVEPVLFRKRIISQARHSLQLLKYNLEKSRQ